MGKTQICVNCNKEKIHHAKGLCKNCCKKKYLHNKQEKSPMILCACGCGEKIHSISINNTEKKYKSGHNLRGQTMEKHPNWRGGRTIHKFGYIYILKPDHPFADVHGYIFEHRLIMEKQLGRYLTREEQIHHINHDKQDNRLENLILTTRAKHMKQYHNKKIDMSDRFCRLCGGKTYINKKGYAFWSKYKDGFICQKCEWKRWSKKKKNS